MSRKKKRKKQKVLGPNRKSKKRKVLLRKRLFLVDSEFQRAIRCHRSGKLKKAQRIYEKILEVAPDHSQSLHLLSAINVKLGKTEEAANLMNKAIESDPNNALYYNDLGTIFQEQGELDKSIACYQKAVELDANFAGAYNNMGIALREQGKLDEAIKCYRKAIYAETDYAEAYNNMGTAFKDQGESDEAIKCYRRALDMAPNDAEALSNLVFELQQVCAWKELESLTDRLDKLTNKALDSQTEVAEKPLYRLTKHTDLSRSLAVARSWSRAVSTPKLDFSFGDRRSKRRKVVIGYLSNDFRYHPVAQLMLSLFGLHDRNRFKVVGYSHGIDDGSHYRKRIQQDCDKFVDLRNLGHADAAKRIYEDNIDILVDLNGHTAGSRLEICSCRPAPIQVTYLGFPGTSGAYFFDYIITDRIVTPQDHAPYYTENFVYLPHSYQVNDHTQSISDKEWQRKDFNLPEDGFIFCSFNQPYKIEPVMFSVWMKILTKVPKGVLWLSWGQGTAKTNLRREAEARGVESRRLVFAENMPMNEHLARLRLADLALDTRVYNGGATTSNALWAGVPVITLQGGHFPSRMSSSLLTSIGLPELITHTAAEYESLAVRLACDAHELETIRQKLATNRLEKPLFDTPRFVRNLEKAYKEMWKIFLAGEQPRRIDVVEN